jgi:hypothetical protein
MIKIIGNNEIEIFNYETNFIKKIDISEKLENSLLLFNFEKTIIDVEYINKELIINILTNKNIKYLFNEILKALINIINEMKEGDNSYNSCLLERDSKNLTFMLS